jgi:hypothetical protein
MTALSPSLQIKIRQDPEFRDQERKFNGIGKLTRPIRIPPRCNKRDRVWKIAFRLNFQKNCYFLNRSCRFAGNFSRNAIFQTRSRLLHFSRRDSSCSAGGASLADHPFRGRAADRRCAEPRAAVRRPQLQLAVSGPQPKPVEALVFDDGLRQSG